ncbi:PspC domain-containing protein [Aquipuribacter sp. MA13-6]|uniref:PspC domain-containing protein n=1 Tax=unclassified Aquipuribacter TaxID=2635084 RepID=UPI003EEBBE70
MEPTDSTSTPTDQTPPTTGTPPPAGPPRGLQPFWDALRRSGVRRPADDRWVGGVCSGTAHRLGVDPVLVRVGVVALTLLGGAGVAVYAVALVLLPDHDGSIELERASYGDLTGTTVGAVALLLLAMVVPGPWDLWRGGALVDGGELVWALLVGTLLVVALAYLPRMREAVERGTAGLSGPTGPPGTEAPTGGGSTAPADGPGHPYVAAPVPSPRPTPVVRPRRRGPGPAVASAVTGAALLAGGAVWLAADQGLLLGRPWLLAACAVLTVLGLGLVGLGLAGRRDGSVGGAAFGALVLTAAVLLVPSWRTAQVAGDVTWAPVTERAAERGGSLGAGEAVLDLRGLSDLPRGAEVEVPVRVGVGSLQVLVPEDMDVVVEAATAVRTARMSPDDREYPGGRDGLMLAWTTGEEQDPQVVVDARVLVGDVELVTVPQP